MSIIIIIIIIIIIKRLFIEKKFLWNIKKVPF